MLCGSCVTTVEKGAIPISCDMCWTWFHRTCTDLQQLPPADESWICVRCARRESRRTVEQEEHRAETEALRAMIDTQARLMTDIIATRATQGISLKRATLRKLPEFSGKDITVWPTFKAVYDQTTREGHYDDIDNCGRLLEYLKDPAKELVQTKLSNPANLNEVMRTLEQAFGNKDRIYDKLIETALSAPSPKDGKRESFFTFANKVSDLVCNVQMMQMAERLKDARLISDFKRKLGPGHQEKWIESTREQDQTSLEVFNNFLQARVTVLREMSLDEPRPSTSRPRGHVHVQGDSDNDTPRSVQCLFCDEIGHKIFQCEQFKNLPVNDRWEAVKELRLCFGCLNRARHQLLQCRVAVICGIEECMLKHHRLLHQPDPYHQPAQPNGRHSHSIPIDTNQARTTTRQGQSCMASQSTPVVLQTRTPPSRPPRDQQSGPSNAIAQHRLTIADREETHSNNTQPLFMIIPVSVQSNEKKVDTFAFLDNGSAFTLVDADLARDLDLSGTPESFSMICAKESYVTEENSIRTSFQIAGHKSENYYNLRDVRTVEKLGLPTGSLNPSSLMKIHPHLKGLPLPHFEKAVPKILIGVNNATLISYHRIVENSEMSPIAVKTKLGWCVFGRPVETIENVGFTFQITHPEEDRDTLHDLVKSYFTTESFGCKPLIDTQKSLEEKQVEKIVAETLVKFPEYYEVGLLWKDDDSQLPNSYPMALKRLKFVEARMKRDPELREWYINEINSYVAKGYCRKLSREEVLIPNSRIFYIPFFHVINENKIPKKIRLVFDAAAKVGRRSLNSYLLTGPNVYVSMPGVIFKAREGTICVAADIREMFPQVKIRPDDQAAQRFLWRGGDSSREPDVYAMTSMIFGACCSPYLAQLVKNQNALRFQKRYPDAVQAVLTQHFVDDYLNSHETVEEAVRIASDVIKIHQEAGFELRNFVSNSPEVLKKLPRASEVTKAIELDWEKDDVTEKILGVHWNVAKDVFEIKLNLRKIPHDILSFARPPTKRELLRITMSIFDPIGLLSHVLIRPKVLIQETWRSGIDWDEQLTDMLFIKWKMWLEKFVDLTSITIARAYSNKMCEIIKIEMHTFVDASEAAFAAVVYFRLVFDDHVECVLITSKSKVAPNKVQSIPRLELQAAVLGSRLANYVKNEHRLKIDNQIFWSDSQTTLSWINCADLQNLKPFVGVRVSEIHELTRACEWRKIPTKMNVADDATKWSDDTCYSHDDRWFKGPEFLLSPEPAWPTFDLTQLPAPMEKRAPVYLMSSPEVSHDGIPLERFSSYIKLTRVFAFMLKFIDGCSRKHDKKKLEEDYQQVRSKTNEKPKLLFLELQVAEMLIVRRAQIEAFPQEYMALLNQKPLPHKSPLIPLTPIMDERKMILMNGRIRRASNLHYIQRFPAILPNNHRVTNLIIQHYHEQFAHGLHEAVLAATRRKYWIMSGRQAVRRVKTNCQFCKNKRAMPQPTLMGELPICRLDWSTKPFTHCGMDLYGPIKAVMFRRPIKCYAMLFTCMVTRAVHIELVMSLNTDDCIMNLRNFLNRRGPVMHFYCDNATNWHGSHNELLKELEDMDGRLARANNNYTITWHFQPPSASHFGGAYERMIQSVQKAMSAVLNDRSPRVETLRSALIECENIINARPLTHVPLEADDEDPLTPNDLLKMHSNCLPAAAEVSSQDVNLRKQ